MSEDVPTFGRENLPREAEKAEWDRLEQWHKRLTEPEDPDHEALLDRRRTGCDYDIGVCACPAAPFEYAGCRAPRHS